MLSSRYVHLHQALGLGPMWLKRGAHHLPNPSPSVPPVIDQALSHINHKSFDKPIHTGSEPITLPTAKAPISQAKPQDLPASVDLPADIHFRSIRALAHNEKQTFLLISLMPNLMQSADDAMKKGVFNTLMMQLAYSIGISDSDLTWTPLFAQQETLWKDTLKSVFTTQKIDSVLILGEEFQKLELFMALCEEYITPTRIAILPHPVKMLQRPRSKADAWKQLKKLL